MKIRRVAARGYRNSDNRRNIADMTLESVGVLFIFLDVRSIAKRLANLLDLCKPGIFIIRCVKNLNIFFKDSNSVIPAYVLRERVIRCINLVIEIRNILLYLVPLCDILTGLCSSPVD